MKAVTEKTWPSKAKPYFYGIAPTLGGYDFGYDTGSISGILVMEQFNGYFHSPSNGLHRGITVWVQAGAFTGNFLTSVFLADALGRRRTILCGAALFTICIAISCAANNVVCLIAGRVINGLANGCTAMMMPLWQSEITPEEIRGRSISLQQCVINFGILSSFLIQHGCSFIPSDAAWRVPLGVQMVPTTALFGVMWFIPESPRWQLSRGGNDDALQVLARVHVNGDRVNEYVKADYEEIKAKFEWEQTVKKPGYFALLFSRKYARRTYIGIGAQFWQKAIGIVRYYPIVQGCYTSR